MHCSEDPDRPVAEKVNLSLLTPESVRHTYLAPHHDIPYDFLPWA